eukprot:11191868-Alexandrium_andersonii.AAC.1
MAPARRGPPVGWSPRAPGVRAPSPRRSWRLRALNARLIDWSTVPPLNFAKRSLAPSCDGGRKWS